MSIEPELNGLDAAALVRALVEELAQARQAQRLALRPETAAAALGLSRDAFDEHVSPHLRWTRVGRIKLVSVKELERWLSESAARTLPDRGRR